MNDVDIEKYKNIIEENKNISQKSKIKLNSFFRLFQKNLYNAKNPFYKDKNDKKIKEVISICLDIFNKDNIWIDFIFFQENLYYNDYIMLTDDTSVKDFLKSIKS